MAAWYGGTWSPPTSRSVSTRNAGLSVSHPRGRGLGPLLNRTCWIRSTVPIHRNCARSRRRWSSWASRCGRLDRSTACSRAGCTPRQPRGSTPEALERPERADSAPIVHLAPALILRRRTERSFIRAFQEIIDQLNSGHPVPEGCRTFVSVSEDPERGNASGESGHAAGPGEIYFPLPANEAQREIVRRLTANQGVLVQGPPGTGKSHTIVNLICHALATGQRVLVTSHAVRALKVLQRKCRSPSRSATRRPMRPPGNRP